MRNQDGSDQELMALAEETVRIARITQDEAIRSRLQTIASQVRDWASRSEAG